MTTIVDTDAILAISDPTDALHARVKRVVQQLGHAEIFLSPTTIAEVSLTAPRKLGLARAREVIQEMTEGTMRIEIVDAHDVQSATQLFYTQKRVEHSLCDCFVMALATRLDVDCIFSFDRGYTTNGFVLIEDFLQARHPKSGKEPR